MRLFYIFIACAFILSYYGAESDEAIRNSLGTPDWLKIIYLLEGTQVEDIEYNDVELGTVISDLQSKGMLTVSVTIEDGVGDTKINYAASKESIFHLVRSMCAKAKIKFIIENDRILISGPDTVLVETEELKFDLAESPLMSPLQSILAEKSYGECILRELWVTEGKVLHVKVPTKEVGAALLQWQMIGLREFVEDSPF
jgi:hypothetical protein